MATLHYNSLSILSDFRPSVDAEPTKHLRLPSRETARKYRRNIGNTPRTGVMALSRTCRSLLNLMLAEDKADVQEVDLEGMFRVF